MKTKKQNNNLVLLNYADGEKLYYTSFNRAGLKIGIQAGQAKWACDHDNVLYDNNDRELKIELIDGSDIPYKYINN